MKGDFSRDTFRPKNHYRRVLKQQGRVDVDADWNEQQAINLRRIETEAVDVIGGCGAPLHAAGFHIVSSFNDLTDAEKTLPGNQSAPVLQLASLFISAGRYYVDGILCENEQIIRLNQQRDLPAQPALKAGTYLAYLDVRERHVTALDDPLLREKALGGPDTATRAKTLWQVKMLSLGGVANPSARDSLLKKKKALEKKLADLLAQTAGKETPETKELRAELARIDRELAALPAGPACDGKFLEWDELVAPSTGKLNARTQPGDAAEQACLLPPSAGYQRLENQLYRVEIHQAGARPTFVWSRDNGTVVTAITSLSGNNVVVADVGPDEVLGFAIGQWVEITDDEIELNGERGELRQIENVDEATRTITLKTVPPAVNLNAHPKLRRWDYGGTGSGSEGVPITSGWQRLEDGIEVQFSQGTFKTGDYWLIPARTATGEIEWPPYEVPNRNPVAQPPAGIGHHYCRLAIVQVDGRQFKVLSDCRKIFPPLTEIAAAPVRAMHVTKFNWVNDEIAESADLVRLFAQEGFRINFDAPPEAVSFSGATMLVTAEAVVSLGENFSAELQFIFDGAVVALGDDAIQWKIDLASLRRFVALLVRMDRLTSVRMRVCLKGSTIWSGRGASRIYLDGQAFGVPALRRDNRTPRTELILPSGAGAKASDFESWFYIDLPRDRAVNESAPQLFRMAAIPVDVVTPAAPVTPAREPVRRKTKRNP